MKIVRKLQPFTHRMGVPIALPGAEVAIVIYPARLEIVGGEAVDLPVTGPITKFTAIQDLEKGGIRVTFTSQEGFIRYTILPGVKQLAVLQLEKGNITLPWEGEAREVNLLEERFFLGSHKKLDWELVLRRKDPTELFPIWHRLGLALPATQSTGPSLLSQAEDLPSLMTLFSAGFDGLMTPMIVDPFHQGFSLPPVVGDSAYPILSHGARLIRSLFFREADSSLLPALPREFASGRMLNISTTLGTLSFEWSKHRLRKATFTASTSGTLALRFPKEVKHCRVNRSARLDSGASYAVSEGEKLLLDRFER